MKDIETPVQPSDLLTQKEFDSLMEACRHPRDKAIIAVLADSGMRVGALASCKNTVSSINMVQLSIYQRPGKPTRQLQPKGFH